MSREWICVDFDRVKAITERAILFVVDGEDTWIPISQISSEDVDQYEVGDVDGPVSITDWIASQKGLL
jgi:hypothetical protein